jgi:hypothetical protein
MLIVKLDLLNFRKAIATSSVKLNLFRNWDYLYTVAVIFVEEN